MCVNVLRVEGKHSADTADFPPEGGKREEGERGEKKKNRYSSKILMAE